MEYMESQMQALYDAWSEMSEEEIEEYLESKNSDIDSEEQSDV